MSQTFTTNVTQNVQSFTTNLTHGIIYISSGGGGGGGTGTGSAIWGEIEGSLSNQLDLSAALSSKLGTGATAINSLTLNGQSGSFYLNYNNLTGKPTGFVPSFHYHNISDVSGLQSALNNKLDSSATGSFYPISNPSGYITGVDLTAYATTVYVTGVSGSLQTQITSLSNQTGSYLLDSETGGFYPRTNPSGYITGVDLTNYVTGSVVRPSETGAFYAAANPSGFITTGDLSGYATESYVQDASGYLESLISASSAGVAALNGQSGVLNIAGAGTNTVSVSGTNIIVSGTTGFLSNYVATSQTGDFYPRSNPSGYITGLDLSAYVLDSETGAFYPASNPSGYITGSVVRPSETGVFITTDQTGDFYPRSNPSGYVTGVDLSNYATTSYVTGVSGSLQSQITNLNNSTGSYVLNSETGAFYPNSNPSGYATESYVTGASGYLRDLISASSAGVAALNGQSGVLDIVGIGTNTVTVSGSNIVVSGTTGFLSGYQVTGDYITSSQTGGFYPISNPSGFITGLDLSSYATSAYVTGVSGDLQAQITTLDNATGSYYPISNPSGYATGIDASNLATTGQLNSVSGDLQGQITSLSNETGTYYPRSNPSGYITGIDQLITSGVIFQSPNGTIFRVTINDNGSLKSTIITTGTTTGFTYLTPDGSNYFQPDGVSLYIQP